MNKKLKREFRLVLLQSLSTSSNSYDYLTGILVALRFSNLITFSTYFRYLRFLDKYRFSKKTISFRGIN